MSADVYSKVAEKMKQENFTEDEIRILAKAKEQLSSYTTGGSVFGGLAGLLLARAKNFRGFQGIAIPMGGVLIGSQIGLVMGAMSSVQTIQSIPNFRRVMTIIQEVREDSTRPGGPGGPMRHDRAATMPTPGHHRFPIQQRMPSELMTDDAVRQQVQEVSAFKDGDGYHGGHDPSNGSMRSEQNSAWSQVPQKVKELQSNSSSWNQIRQQNMPKSAWNEIRDGRHPSSRTSQEEDAEDKDVDDGHANALDNVKKPSSVRAWDRVRQNSIEGFVGPASPAPDGPSDFARTREDLESKPSVKKNQYGDLL
ncbi:hypothetical protein BX616_002138 [Lobosporangium transversale]|uniref:Uncharacterized protein n=1 Tax=Lobosporangium transversale TaxID=64571 RepID=A0A1Y2GXC9_9FUNG|nr:hypothetical protein BCR41DRAFT_420155 [Lobosporangium transversale]KAF9901837.1 hypothetical protein BX616_002138 [Lobosporangium transversale]ORZ24907.1 hypothetical protein BCR41DRAFT_420155 [Lobosporangium transversale]|eukprot:XP_021883888.1 hypothetical protein BCR41DRAFT_420155 [Lobosporangium transversale]